MQDWYIASSALQILPEIIAFTDKSTATLQSAKKNETNQKRILLD